MSATHRAISASASKSSLGIAAGSAEPGDSLASSWSSTAASLPPSAPPIADTNIISLTRRSTQGEHVLIFKDLSSRTASVVQCSKLRVCACLYSRPGASLEFGYLRFLRSIRYPERPEMKSPLSRLIYPGASRSITVEQVKSTLRPGEELIWRESIRNERIGLIVRPPSSGQGWIVFFYGNGMTLGGTVNVRQQLANAGYGVVCVEYVGYGVSSGAPSEQGCYRAADAAITYLQREASATLDQLALVGWSLGSAVAMDQASRRTVRAQVLLSPLGRVCSPRR